jgi:hypothetical protein
MMRYVTSESGWYIYDPESVTIGGIAYRYGVPQSDNFGNWFITAESGDAYLASTTVAGGCDRPLNFVENALSTPPKTGVNSTPLRVWLSNGLEPDGLSPTPVGTQYSFVLRISGVDQSVLFSDRIIVNQLGLVNRLTVEINTTVEGTYEQIIWNPQSNLVVTKVEVPRGFAIAYDITLSFENEDLAAFIAEATQITIEIVKVSSGVSQIDPGIISIFGEGVLPDGGKLLILPSFKRMPGKATIEPSYFISRLSADLILGNLQEDTPDQLIAIDGALNGLARVRTPSTLALSERIRAYVSTEPIFSDNLPSISMGVLSSVSNSISLADSDEAVVVTITHATKIREDYPDSLVAGNTDAELNAPFGRIIFDFEDENQAHTYYRSGLIPITGASQTVTFTSPNSPYSGGGILAGFPTSTKGLFKAESVSISKISQLGTSFIGGTLTVYFAYSYGASGNDRITEIDHQRIDCIPTTEATIAEAASGALIKANNLLDVPNKALARTNLGVPSITDVEANTSAIASLSLISGLVPGLAVGNVVQLVDVGGGVPGFPAIDGSLLTGISGGGGSFNLSVTDGTNTFANTSILNFSGATLSNLGSGQVQITTASSLELKSGAETLPGVESITLTGGATLSDLGSGEAEIAIAQNNLGISDGTTTLNNITQINLERATVASGGAGIATIDVPPNLTLTAGAATLSEIDEITIVGGAIASTGTNSAQLTFDFGAGTLFLPNSQSLFVAPSNTDVALYNPEIGTALWESVKILTTASAPDNQIINDQLVIGVADTAAVIDLATKDTILELSWLVESGIPLIAVLRYESEGNCLLVEFSTSAIAIKSVISDAIATIDTASYTFTVSNTYLIQIRVVGVQIEVLVKDPNWTSALIAYSPLFLSSTKFGVGRD